MIVHIWKRQGKLRIQNYGNDEKLSFTRIHDNSQIIEKWKYAEISLDMDDRM